VSDPRHDDHLANKADPLVSMTQLKAVGRGHGDDQWYEVATEERID